MNRNFKYLKTFESYINSINEADAKDVKTDKKKITIEFDIEWNDNIGKVKQDIILAMSSSSVGLFSLADDIEKYTGLTKKEAEEYNETEKDAYVYGMCNAMNGGKDIFFWTNGTRLKGEADRIGAVEAVTEQLSHECVHLTRLLLSKDILNAKGIKKWVGDEPWPSIGDDTDENLIDEEAFATAQGLVVQQLTDDFIEMASAYIPDLKELVDEIKNEMVNYNYSKFKSISESKHPISSEDKKIASAILKKYFTKGGFKFPYMAANYILSGRTDLSELKRKLVQGYGFSEDDFYELVDLPLGAFQYIYNQFQDMANRDEIERLSV